jgi:hypothetical protein
MAKRCPGIASRIWILTIFRRQAMEIVGRRRQGGAVFCLPENGTLKLLAVLRTGTLLVAGCDAPEGYPSMAAECEPFHMFEREIAEQYGIRPEGHPWLKMVRYHPTTGQTGCVRQ